MKMLFFITSFRGTLEKEWANNHRCQWKNIILEMSAAFEFCVSSSNCGFIG